MMYGAPRLGTAFAAAVLFASPAAAQSVDEEYARSIREHTSDPRFLPASLSSLPAHATIPSPLEHFGTIIGAPGVMHRTAEVHGYYQALASATPRVAIEEIGTSEEGRPLVLVVIADEQTMGRLDHYRSQLDRLADPRGLDPAEADGVIVDAKPVYYLNGGLHSPEMGSPEMLMELAYRLAASDEPAMRKLRENVITVINPVAEPDGRDKQVDWYYRYTKTLTDWDDPFPRSAPYWGRYVYHDNNRDGLQISQALTKAIFDGYYRWHPTVMHDLHESVPLLYVMTGTGPYNETIDPITIGEWQVFANHDMTQVTAEGLPGVFTWAFYDGWWPGYAIWVANNHNGIGRFYETFGNAGANTYIRDLSNSRYAGDPVTERTWYRPDPPTRKVRWSARDNVNYMQAGVVASMTYTADNGEQLLRNFYRKGVNNLERGRTEKPHAFVIPKDQADPRRTAYLVNQLRRQAIEVHRRTAGDSAGDYVVLMNQPYRNLAVTLLTKQNFPQDADHPPYDDIAWTLGYLYGVDVTAVDDTSVFTWQGLELLSDTVAYTGTLAGSGDIHLIANRGQDEILPALYWLREEAPRATAFAAEAAFDVGAMTDGSQDDSGNESNAAESFDAGTIILEGVDGTTARQLTERFGLDLVATASPPAVAAVARHELDLPRVAVYHTWFSTQDEGWVRFTLEQLAIPYTSIDKDDLRAGDLRRRFDVILVPSVGGGVQQLIHGVDPDLGPMPYTRTDEFPSHGTPDSTDDMTGGPGFAGLHELQRFVESGGVLLTLENATALAVETGITRTLRGHGASGLFHPGSVVRVKARRPDHPILYGFPETFHVFRGNAPLYQTALRDRGVMVLQYGTRPLEDERESDEGRMLGIPEDFGAEADSARADSAADRPRTPPEIAQVAPADSAATPDPAAGEQPTGEEDASDENGGYVLSGMVRNENQIVGHGAIFDVPVGQGRVVAFTFNPLHRFLNHHEFPLVWNTLMNWNDLD
jgi:hypothetical protein